MTRRITLKLVLFTLITTLFMGFNSFSAKAATSNHFTLPLDGLTKSTGYSGFIPNRVISESKNTVAHLACDYVSSTGNWNVMSIYPGTVYDVRTALSDDAGRYVCVKHNISGMTVYSFYQHLKSVSVAVGQSVSGGDVIGIAGQTGTTETQYDRHLHLSVFSGTYDWSKPRQTQYGQNVEENGPITIGETTYYNPQRLFDGSCTIGNVSGVTGESIVAYENCTYKIIKAVTMRKTPYDSGDKGSSLSVGQTITSDAIVDNGTNYWVRITAIDGKDLSEEQYIFSGYSNTGVQNGNQYLQYVESNPGLNWANDNVTGLVHTQGSFFPIKGTIECNHTIKSITAMFYDSTACYGKPAVEQNVNSTSYYLPSSTIDKGMLFGELSTGNYTLDLAVEYYTNRKLSTATAHITAPFTVVENASSVKSYYLDINGCLNGESTDWLNNFGTCDVYINDALVANDVNDYYTAWPTGTKYAIKDIKPASSYAYNGNATISGTIGSSDVTVVLDFERPSKPVVTVTPGNTYTATVFSWEAVTGTTHYDVRIYDANGNIVWGEGARRQTNDKLKYSALLTPGNYSVSVAATNEDKHSWNIGNKVSFTVPSASAPSAGTHIAQVEGNHHLYKVIQKSCTWLQAEYLASKASGNLATITSSAEQSVVAGLVKQAGFNCWLGAERYRKGTWAWVTGESFSYKNWSSGEPSNSNGVENVLEMYNGTGVWNDNAGTNNVAGYVVEFNPTKVVVSTKNSSYPSGTTFTKDDLTVKVTFADGTTLKTSDYTITSQSCSDGTYTIKVSYGSLSASCNVTASTSVTGVNLNASSVTLNVGNTTTLTATVSPSNATNKNVTWSSSNTSIATVSSSGVVTAKADGEATITCKTADGGYTATCKVTVKVPVSGVLLEPLVVAVSGVNVRTGPSTSYDIITKLQQGESLPYAGGMQADADGTIWYSITVNGGTGWICSKYIEIEQNQTSAIAINQGDSRSLYYYVVPQNATNKNVTWSSSNTAVATVSGGKVTAVGNGTATITCKTVDGGYTATCTVTVTTPATGVTLSATTATLKAGETLTLTPTISPSTASNKAVTWSSGNTAVATVSDGKVTAVSNGTAIIYCTTVDGGYWTSCKVFVLDPVDLGTDFYALIRNMESQKLVVAEGNAAYSNVILSSETFREDQMWHFVRQDNGAYKIYYNDSLMMELAGGKVDDKTNIRLYTDTGDSAQYWYIHKNGDGYRLTSLKAPGSCVDIAGAKVDDGANIQLFTEHDKANQRFAIELCTLISSVELDKTGIQFDAIGASETLTAIVLPSDSTYSRVVWKTSDASVATVSEGVVTSVGNGTATITCTTPDGRHTAECAVTVAVPPQSVTLDRSSAVLHIGETLTLTPTVLPSDAANKDVTWYSSDPSVAAVSNGTITAVKCGTATITCTTVESDYSATCTVAVYGTKKFVLPVDLKIIESEAFRQLAMDTIILSSNTESIGSKAFADCNDLRIIYMPDSVVEIAEDAFDSSDNVCFVCESENAAAIYAKNHSIPYVVE